MLTINKINNVMEVAHYMQIIVLSIILCLLSHCLSLKAAIS